MTAIRCAACDALLAPHLGGEPCPVCGSTDRRLVADEWGDEWESYLRAALREGSNDRVVLLTWDEATAGLEGHVRRQADDSGGVVLVGVQPDGELEDRAGIDPHDWLERMDKLAQDEQIKVQLFGLRHLDHASIAYVVVDPGGKAERFTSADIPSGLDPVTAIRTTRSRPPELAKDSAERRDSYRAAIAQFEELLAAASHAGPASRPLLLYYALTQGGNAILAARAPDPTYKPHHGLRWSRRGPVLERRISFQSTGAFPAVATCLGSRVPTRSVSLGEIWRALPEFNDHGLPTRAPIPIQAWLWTEGRYPDWIKLRETRVGIVLDVSVEHYEELEKLLENYPTSPGWEPAALGGGVQYAYTPRGMGVVAYWRADGWTEGDHQRRFASVAPPYRNLGSWLIPDVGETQQPMRPLLGWWVVLYGLSMLSRYEPGTWTRALNIDHSAIAGVLEALMEEALRAIPDLVLEELASRTSA